MLAEVIDLSPTERSARIAQLCGDRPELREEVESILAAHEKAASFLDVETKVDSSAGPGFSLAGRQFGPYRLLTVVGMGGMGTVYRAERTDGRFQRQVAIKVVPAALHSPELLRRFTSEQQILAALEHPSIGALLDAGVSSEGIPYFVMEYVEGIPVNEYCDNHRLSIPDRLKLFQTLCSAVQYAHQHLVVHRDLKPANILVTGDGVPKLLDFGIAKIVDPWTPGALDATRSLLNPMTPGYASPEQVRGETLTTATDIYSLGVVLYQLLTGEPPYRVAGKSLSEAIRVICESEPEKPSALVRLRNSTKENAQSLPEVSSDLDAIVAKAMRKDPQQRYASAQEFSADIGRSLAGLPVSAHQGSLRYVAAKFVTRHKLAVLGFCVAVIMAAGGIGAVLWQARATQRERIKAERRFQQVRSLAKSLMFEVHDSIRDLPGATPARQLIVSRALEYLDGLAREAGDDPSLQRELSAAYERIGDVQGNPYLANLGDTLGALASYRKSLAIRESLLSADPNNFALKRELSGIDWKIGICLDGSSDFSGALASLRKALELTQQDSLANRDWESSDRLAGDHWAVAHVLQETGDLAGALENYRTAASIRESSPGTEAGQIRTSRTHLAGDYFGMAEVLKAQGQLGPATDAGGKSLALLGALSHEDPNNATLRQYLAGSYTLLGQCFELQSLLDQAINNYTGARKIYEAQVAADPTDALSSRLVGYIDMQIAGVLVKQGKAAQGLDLLQRALVRFQEIASKAPTSNYISYNFGNVYSEMASAHVALASDNRLPVATRRTHWTQARDLYQKSLTIWLDLRQRGKLGGDEVGEPERLPGEIAKCTQALGRLQGSRQ